MICVLWFNQPNNVLAFQNLARYNMSLIQPRCLPMSSDKFIILSKIKHLIRVLLTPDINQLKLKDAQQWNLGKD